MEELDFEKFGMTKIEAKIFFELLKTGSIKLGPLAKRLNIHRGTIYNSLNRLIGKGFVVFFKNENETYYNAADPHIFLDLVNLEKEKIKQKEQEAKKIVGTISHLVKEIPSRRKVFVSWGKRAYMHHHWEMLRTCKDKKIEYCWIGDGLGNTSRQVGEDNYRKIINTRKAFGVKCRSIMNYKAADRKHKDYLPNDRYLPENYSLPTYTWIYDNRVVIVIWEAKPMIIITIEDGATAKSYKNYFNAMYKIAKTYNQIKKEKSDILNNETKKK